MKLLNPGLGDVLDRLTILGLKIQHGRLQGESTEHWEEEQVALNAYAESRWKGMAFDHKLILQLAAANAVIWNINDSRESHDQPYGPILRHDLEVRHEAIRKLNVAGGGDGKPEKL